MSKHTPGPWRVDPVSPTSIWIRTGLPGGGANFPVAHIGANHPETLQRANARLIAAAPELLEALERLADVVHGDYGGPIDAARRNARTAIAKAKGEA